MPGNRRILIIDDLESIHADYRKILCPKAGLRSTLATARASFLGRVAETRKSLTEDPFDVEFALQGKEGFELARRAEEIGKPFAVAFVDMRMPPGWDGLETIKHLWQACPAIQTVICTAHSDYSWKETIERLGQTDRLLILKKPFDAVEVRQLAEALTQKWDLARRAEFKLSELAEMVAEQTRDLEHARNELLALNASLERSKQAAEAANQSKSEFLANMSHEIRTPTSVIVGYADVLCDAASLDLADCEQQTALEAIRRNAEYLLAIINDILDISKIEAGHLEIERLDCSPEEIIADAVALVKPLAERKGVALRLECQPEIPPRIVTDPTRLKQIAVNLIGNAVKFSDDGEVVVTARMEVNAGKSLLVVEVRDQGIGMTPEQLKRLFQPFAQADMSMSRRFGGTGLGLAISRRLANMLGGDVSVVDSKTGGGTTMRAAVEAGASRGVGLVPQAEKVAPEISVGAATGDEDGDGRVWRVLVAEDGPDNQRLISFVLRRAGLDVTLVANGREAVEAAQAAVAERQPYDVILMDMQMPLLDGYGATAELRRMNISTPIVALTAQTLSDDKSKCLQVGCDAYVSKPFKRDELVAIVRRYLKRPAEQRATV